MRKMVPFMVVSLIILIAGCTSTNQDTRQTPRYVSLADSQVFALEAAPMRHEINGAQLDMYAYNGQIPGPTIKAARGSTIYINFTNKLGEDTTIHWHGIRLDNMNDGTIDVQAPVKPGESFMYKIILPDYGVYWYHPHIREDRQQELGLYGNIIVDGGFGPADDELAIILDDIKVTNGKIDSFYDFSRFSLMGRFGNHILANGQTDFKTDVKRGLVRIYLTNAANARPFNFSIKGRELRIVGGDSGRYEKEFTADSVVISPGERYIAEVLFENTGSFDMMNIHPGSMQSIGRINVVENDNQIDAPPGSSFEDFERMKSYNSSPPDFEFVLTMQANGMGHEGHGTTMRSRPESIEWEDDMGMMNSISTSKNTRWIIRDKSGRENEEIVNKAGVGDVKKIRIFNDPGSMHPMQHPMHLHGQRFIILSENNKTNDNFVWKDTVLVPTGATTDILVNFTNPGKWMFHCHIAEHLEAGMTTTFEVSE